MDIELKASEVISMSLIDPNKGQIEGLPKNPRFIRDNRFKRLVKSIADDPEMLGLRELLVCPRDGKYVVIGGNMRYRAMKELGYAEAPCKVLPEDTPPGKLRAYALKDNGDFGEWDLDLLANEWDFGELDDFGVDLPSDWGGNEADSYGDTFSLPDGDKADGQTMSFTLSGAQAETVREALKEMKGRRKEECAEYDGNTNTNGNALFLIVREWEGRER